MRPRFKEWCETHHTELQIFFPEFAMKNYFSSGVYEPFNIADFEALVAELSHAIVLFPEAAGSFAEAGYFSLVPELASKTILALDSYYQGTDSFISQGPADKFNKQSRFNNIIQLSYADPNFTDIIGRINRIPFSRHRKSLQIEKFSILSNYDLFCLIHKCFELLSIATIEDIIFVLRGLFNSQISVPKVKQIASILAGSKRLAQVGEYGHYCVSRKGDHLAFVKDGFAEEESAIKIEIAGLIAGAGELASISDEASLVV